MKFTFINSLNISTNLSVLRRGTQPYSALLYQHEGCIHADTEAIGNSTDVTPQLESFIVKALKIDADIALTPEYCCPWAIIKSIVEDQSRWPSEGKLWAYGCESITKENLRRFYTDNTSDNVFIHFESQVLRENKRYLDPLVYIFRGIHEERPKLIILIQFKTAHMGVWSSTVERDHLIQGETVYILSNSDSSVRFLSLICSEAMGFREAMTPEVKENLQWSDMPYLIFNPQLNPKPIAPQFCDFRKFVLATRKKEIISLNWANTTKFMGKPFLPEKSSRSGFFIESQEADLSHDRIKQNHKLGMYYFTFGQYKHAYILNSTTHAFHIQNLPVDITEGIPSQRKRDGPQTIEVFSFKVADSTLEALPDVSDLHLQYLQEVGCTCVFLNDADGCILEKEMLVSLTSGKIDKNLGSTWNQITNLYALNSSEQIEENRRITYAEDTSEKSDHQRGEYINAISELEYSVFTRPTLFPKSIRDLRQEQLKIGYSRESNDSNYKYNVITSVGAEKKATICFLNTPSLVDRTFNNLQDIFDKDNQNRGRVVVFYRKNGLIYSKFDDQAGKITNSNVYDNESFRR